ncbi:MAG: PP2C family protein-serine/threonine phosphatase [Marmoricola sp.]
MSTTVTSRRTFRSWPVRLRRELTYSDRLAMLVMVVLAVVVMVWGAVQPDVLPYTVMVLPMFIGSLWLGPRTLPWYVVICLIGVTVMVASQPTVNSRSVARILVTFAMGLLILLTSFRRGRLGVSGPRSESMFVDLRDRIARQGGLPTLPAGWHAEAAVRTAGGTAFAGDFVVSGHASGDTEVGEAFGVALVDVSGKGVEAGTRSLLLSGAFGGLLVALRPEDFLPAANEYLFRQQWEEGFATAIHLHLDLRTGGFALRKAGHPPALWLQAGSGRWRTLESEGPVLGLVPEAEFELVEGVLRAGDALVLYTDGLVERTRRDIGSGIDRLAGQVALLPRDGFTGGAERILDRLATGADDCAVLIVHRAS